MKITCTHCKKIIGNVLIHPSGRVEYLEENGILAVRKRLDGVLGVECICGNDTRLAECEKGIIFQGRPNKRDTQRVFNRMKNPRIKKKAKSLEIESFIFSGKDFALAGGTNDYAA